MDLGGLRDLAELRVCTVCGAEFRTIQTKEREISALEQFADHTAVHQPSPGQWTEAYNRIRAGKEGLITEVPPVNEELRDLIRDRKAGIR